MSKPLFSLLIANYNNGKYFEMCFKSIVNQDFENLEVIIVDDASTDDSVKIIKNIISNDKRFKFYENVRNYGCGYTKRRCIELATSEIVGFLDPDDSITENAIDIMFSLHNENKDVSLIYSSLNLCDDNLNFQSIRRSKQVENENVNFFNFEGLIFHFTTFKKSFYSLTEGINPYLKRAIDQDLSLKLYEKGKVLYVDEILYNYRIHENGISTLRNTNKAYFWHWVVVIEAAKRRNINVESIFLEKAMTTSRERALEKEISEYNKSIIFKIIRKLGLFKI